MAATATASDIPDSLAQIAPLARTRPPQRAILHVVLLYASSATLWVLLSDKALAWLIESPERLALAGILKGWGFVAVTALGLYVLLGRWSGRADAALRADPDAQADPLADPLGEIDQALGRPARALDG